MNHDDASTEPKKRRRIFILLLVLLVACVAVVVAVVVLTTKSSSKNSIHGSQSNGELHLSESRLEREERAEEDVSILLSDLYSSEPTVLVEVSNTSNYTNATFHSYGNSTQNDTLNDLQISRAPSAAPTTAAPTPAPTFKIATTVNSFAILHTISHDSSAFTQGLTFDPQDSDVFYESTGLYGRSDVRKVNIASGQVILQSDSPWSVFGEGLAYYTTDDNQGRLIHITWKSRRGFIFDSENLERLEEFRFSTHRNEGWGITYNPNMDQFLVTDGSQYLHFWDRNRSEVGRIPVLRQDSETSTPQPVTNLNEIEWDDETHTVLANIWQTNNIVRIDPVTGRVITVYDLSQLYPNRPSSANVLNGIAISPAKELWVTGKLWDRMFKIEFNER